MSYDEPVDILVMEDNENERASIVAVLRASIADVQIVVVRNGTEALDFLFARGTWANRDVADSPKLVLLDLSLPEADGLSILGEIRSLEPDDALTFTPVVIFSDSHNPRDIRESYRCGENSYIMKPVSFSDFQAVVGNIGNYWVNHNRIPA